MMTMWRPTWLTDTRVPLKVLTVVSAGVAAAALLRPEAAHAASPRVAIASVHVSSPAKATGTVKGRIQMQARSGAKLTFTVAKPAKGTASISPDGVFTYTPTAAARHAAAKDGAWFTERSDTVRVVVTDAQGNRASKSVRVPILGANTAPVASVTVDAPHPTTGVVTGRFDATDPDGDPLTFRVTAGTTSVRCDCVTHQAGAGAVAVDQATGAFTYTPTTTYAPQGVGGNGGAGGNGGVGSTDSFTVTITDGYGGTTAVPVSVPLYGGSGGNGGAGSSVPPGGQGGNGGAG